MVFTNVAALQVRISVVETYCERIRDLLDPTRDNLQVKQDAAGAIFIEGTWLHNGIGARWRMFLCMSIGVC